MSEIIFKIKLDKIIPKKTLHKIAFRLKENLECDSDSIINFIGKYPLCAIVTIEEEKQ